MLKEEVPFYVRFNDGFLYFMSKILNGYTFVIVPLKIRLAIEFYLFIYDSLRRTINIKCIFMLDNS